MRNPLPTRRCPQPWQAAIALLALALPACGGSNLAFSLVKAPEFKPAGQTKCGVRASQSRPLIVEWPSADRAAIEAQKNAGLVAVRYLGCEMEVLRRCSAPGKYKYAPVTLKEDNIRIRNADELYASIPVYAAKFEGKLETAGELNVDMSIVGTYEADKGAVKVGELEGSCAGATHFVSAITAGAFEFTAGASAKVGAGAEALGASAGAESAAEREMLNRDGDRQACRRATAQDQAPPDGCGALLRVEVAPLDRAAGTWAADDPTAPPPGWGPSPYAAGSGVPSSVLSGIGGRRQSRLGKTSFVLGSVLLAIGLGTGIGAIMLDSDLDEACGEEPCHPENAGTVHGYYALATSASIGIIGGGALGAAGAIIWGTAAPAAPAAEQARIAPVVGPGLLGVQGRF